MDWQGISKNVVYQKEGSTYNNTDPHLRANHVVSSTADDNDDVCF